MPQMDIKPADTDDGQPYLTVGWDEGNKSFLILYASEKGRRGYVRVKLREPDIRELKRFLVEHYT